MSFDTLQEPHASRAKRLSRTKVVGALSAGSGSAVGFVSTWKSHVSIDDVAINPSFMVASEDAERALIAWQVAEAHKAGITDIRLTPGGLQLDDVAFYAACGFHPVEGSEQLSYAGEAGAATDAAPEQTAAADQGEGEPVAASAPPDGFTWGGTF